jgi:predicted nucleotidyltransferase
MMDIAALIRRLKDCQVEFIVIGGVAAAAHGSARATFDLDVVYRRTPENIERLARCLQSHRPYLRNAPPGLPFRFDPETIQRGLNFTLVTDLGPLDVLGEVTGGGKYEDLLPHAVTLDAFGVSCPCLNLRLLIQVKRAAGRPKDFEAVAEMEALLDERRKSSERS